MPKIKHDSSITRIRRLPPTKRRSLWAAMRALVDALSYDPPPPPESPPSPESSGHAGQPPSP